MEKSLQDLMEEAYRLSLHLTYATVAPDGTYFFTRESLPCSGNDEDTISSWADGLMHKYYEKRASGRCSLQAMVDFDVEKFEEQVKKDIGMMTELLKKVPPVKKHTPEEMRAMGYVWKD